MKLIAFYHLLTDDPIAGGYVIVFKSVIFMSVIECSQKLEQEKLQSSHADLGSPETAPLEEMACKGGGLQFCLCDSIVERE